MERLIKKLFFIIILFLMTNCKKNDKVEFINCKTLILIDSIYKININRSILTLNNNYKLDGCSPLIFDEKFPSWIKDYDKPDFSFNKYIFEPDIYDIKPPYKIYKQKDSCFFYIVKNNDTLKFKITEIL